jgi:predicted HAD superfamily Cof-like phosphohydrolase
MSETETGTITEFVHAYHVRMHPDHLGGTPQTITPELLAFRRWLHDEEVREVAEAWNGAEDAGLLARPARIAHLLHELADVVIVAYGTADYLGVDFDQVLRAVMRANMAKVPPTVPGGKATKPAGWVPADAAVLDIVCAADGPPS